MHLLIEEKAKLGIALAFQNPPASKMPVRIGV